MNKLKYALLFFFAVDTVIFFISQVAPDLLVTLLPQFNIESTENTYPRLVGILFLMLGIARLYGGLFIHERGAVLVSIWSWTVELIYIGSELISGPFVIGENIATLILAPLMLAWSIVYYKKTFVHKISN